MHGLGACKSEVHAVRGQCPSEGLLHGQKCHVPGGACRPKPGCRRAAIVRAASRRSEAPHSCTYRSSARSSHRVPTSWTALPPRGGLATLSVRTLRTDAYDRRRHSTRSPRPRCLCARRPSWCGAMHGLSVNSLSVAAVPSCARASVWRGCGREASGLH